MIDPLNSTNRHLPWDGCYNARDLGGLPTKDGSSTRWRSIIRSDNPSRLSETGRQALFDYGVRTILDLRSQQEAASEPSIFAMPAAEPPQPNYLNLPLEAFYPHVRTLISKAAHRGEVYCIILDYYPALIATALRAIVYAQPGGVLIHCHAGKDRTGTICALLLRLADVPDELILADYAESQIRLWPQIEKQFKEAGDAEKADIWVQPTAIAEMMQIMLDHLDAKYGGVQEYLKSVGLSEREMELLRGKLR